MEIVDWVFMTLAGFPCDDVSDMNVHANSAANRSCVKDSSLRTGAAFQGLVDHIEQKSPLVTVLENVLTLKKIGPDGKSNLDHCLEKLAKKNISSIAFELDSSSYGWSQTRGRLYLVCSKYMTDDDLRKVGRTLERFKSKDPVCKSHFLLPASDPYLEKVLHELMEKKRGKAGTGSSRTGAKGAAKNAGAHWPNLHKHMAKGDQDNAWQDPVHSAQYPWFDILSERERDMVSRSPAGFTLRELSQQMDRGSAAPRTDDLFPIVIPRSLIWNDEQQRLVVAVEKLAAQGITIDRETAAKFTEEELSDLAGNAFCMPTFLIVVVSVLLVLAQKYNEVDQGGAADEPADMGEDLGDLINEGVASLVDKPMVTSSCENLGDLIASEKTAPATAS